MTTAPVSTEAAANIDAEPQRAMVSTDAASGETGLQESGGTSECSGYAYPSQLTIRNTFLGTGPDRPPSLEGFLQERGVRSCPVSYDNENDAAALLVGVQCVPSAASTPSFQSPPRPSRSSDPVRVMLPSSPELESMYMAGLAPPDEASLADAAACGVDPVMCGVHYGQPSPLGFPGVAYLAAAPQDAAISPVAHYGDGDADHEGHSLPVLRLADALGYEPVLGSPELPTAGSAGHHMGNCKPCAFVEKGCMSGVDCKFCHLCPADEKKRRKKEKLQFRRQMDHFHQSVTGHLRLGLF
mmetsp:Transcript_115273/g.325744  ORF Transcript_115273/g.325744 Transcript_115273/m.325744 type:complete len:298 (-) Transcript_115273:67-960(-)